MNQDKDQKTLKIQKIKSDFSSFLNATIKNRNKKIQEILKIEDDKKIKHILDNLR